MYRVTFFRSLLLAFLLTGSPAGIAALKISHNYSNGTPCSITINVSGTIGADDVPVFRDFASGKYFQDNGLTTLSRCRNEGLGPEISFRFNSNGGDVAAALAIGRIIRSIPGTSTFAQNCASACVLVFAGGSIRHVQIWKDNRGVGLHRFYFPQNNSTSLAQVRAMRDETKTKILSFLKEMDISERVLDISEGTPPEGIRWLSTKEAEELRLHGADPNWDEITVSRKSNTLGISSMEFRKRRAEVAQRCAPFDVDCEQQIILGMSRAEIREQSQRLGNACLRDLAGGSEKMLEDPIGAQKWLRCVESRTRAR